MSISRNAILSKIADLESDIAALRRSLMLFARDEPVRSDAANGVAAIVRSRQTDVILNAIRESGRPLSAAQLWDRVGSLFETSSTSTTKRNIFQIAIANMCVRGTLNKGVDGLYRIGAKRKGGLQKRGSHGSPQTRDAVLAAINGHTTTRTVAEIVKKHKSTISDALGRLVAEGKIVKVSVGVYRRAEESEDGNG